MIRYRCLHQERMYENDKQAQRSVANTIVHMLHPSFNFVHLYCAQSDTSRSSMRPKPELCIVGQKICQSPRRLTREELCTCFATACITPADRLAYGQGNYWTAMEIQGNNVEDCNLARNYTVRLLSADQT